MTEHSTVVGKFAFILFPECTTLPLPLCLLTVVPHLPVQRSRSRSMSVVAREELCKSPVMFNAYAELNVPNFGVDIDIPSEVDYYTVNQARRVAKDTVSERVDNHGAVMFLLLLS